MKSRAQAPRTFRKTILNPVAWIALDGHRGRVRPASAVLRAESAASFFKHGQTAEAREDYDAAFDNYQKAYTKAPKNLEYRSALYRIRVTASAAHMTKGRKLQEADKDQEALSEFLRAAEIDPSNEAAQQAIAQVRKKDGEIEPRPRPAFPKRPATRKTWTRWALRPS